MFKLYCCGSRGSRPVEGRKFNEFGGYTSCYILKTYDYALIIDCGTGFYEANAIVADCTNIDIILTHVHYDHILGMLDWTAIPKTSNVKFYANFDEWFGQETMHEFFKKPFWPVQPDFSIYQCPLDGEALKLRNDLYVEFYKAPHPNGAKLLMIKTCTNATNGTCSLEDCAVGDVHKLAVMFDCEKSDGLSKEILFNSDIMIYDGMYTDSEYPSKVGYGHSTWQEGCRLASNVNCGRLIITHHSPNRSDADLRIFEEDARFIYPDTDFARAGQSWDFPLFEKNKKAKTIDIIKSQDGDSVFDTYEANYNKNVDKKEKKIVAKFKELGDIFMDNEKTQKYMMTMSLLIIALVSLVMTIVNIITKENELMWSTLAFSLVCFINYSLIKIDDRTQKLVVILFQVEFLILLLFFIIYGYPEGFSIIWALLLPSVGMLVFGRKRSIVLCSIIFVILALVFWTPIGDEIFKAVGNDYYSSSTKLRFPFVFIAFTVIGYVIELLREFGFKKLNDLKNTQRNLIADQTSELREQNLELLRVNSQLGLRNRLLNKTFGRFMPDQVVEELLDNPNTTEVEGKKVFVTMLQSDIRGFTAMSSSMEAIDIFEMLNNYFSEMTEIVQKNNGTILDYIGDGMLVVFGAPLELKDHADIAIEVAFEMQKAMRKVNAWNKANGYPEMEIGIGINSGEAILGTVGSSNHMKFDAIGNTVNMCSRIEGACEGKKILVTDEVLKNLKKSVRVAKVSSKKLKGIDEPINLFEIEDN